MRADSRLAGSISLNVFLSNKTENKIQKFNCTVYNLNTLMFLDSMRLDKIVLGDRDGFRLHDIRIIGGLSH